MIVEKRQSRAAQKQQALAQSLEELNSCFEKHCRLVHADMVMVRYNGNGEVVIHIENLRHVFSFGVTLLENLLTDAVVPLQRVLFVDGKRIVRGKEGIRLFSQEKGSGKKPRCGCDGMCAECGCGHSKRSFNTVRSA